MTDNPLLSPSRRPEGLDAALRPKTLDRSYLAIVVGYSACILYFLREGGFRDQSLDEVVGWLMFLMWVLAPIGLPFLLARCLGKPWVWWSSLIHAVVFGGISLALYFLAIFHPGSSTDGLVFIFLPACLWLGWGVALAIGNVAKRINKS